MHSVTAIIVTYNSAQVIAPCLQALLAEPLIADVMVVDNASVDGTAELISRRFPGVTLMRNERNLGFGAGNNVALAQVRTEFALLVNPDAALKPGALALLLDAAQRYPDAGLLAPQLFHADGAPQVNYKPDLFTREVMHGRSLPSEGDLCAGFLSGALWLTRMAALRKTGFFDEKLFFYYEDDDLCLRLRRAGHALVLVEAAHAVHDMGTSSAPSEASRAFRLYHDTWSRLYIEYKYRGTDAAWRMLARKGCGYKLRLALGKICCISSLKCRYGPRWQASRDFEMFLGNQPRQ